jgi:hypothetical protein
MGKQIIEQGRVEGHTQTLKKGAHLADEISNGVGPATVEQDKPTARVQNVGHAAGKLLEGTVPVVVGKVPQISTNEIPQGSRERRARIIAVSM